MELMYSGTEVSFIDRCLKSLEVWNYIKQKEHGDELWYEDYKLDIDLIISLLRRSVDDPQISATSYDEARNRVTLDDYKTFCEYHQHYNQCDGQCPFFNYIKKWHKGGQIIEPESICNTFMLKEHIEDAKKIIQGWKNVHKCDIKKLTLDEAIEHAEEVAKEKEGMCQSNHQQLAEWLKELRRLRNQQPIFDKNGRKVATF